MTEQTKKKDVKSFRRAVANLKTLTLMQLKEKMDVSYLRSFKKTLFKIIFTVIEFAAITALCFLLFYLSRLLSVFDLYGGKIPANILTTVLAVMLILSTVFTTIGLVQSLYLSKDNLVLLTFPAKPTMVFLSKLLVYYIRELKKNFIFLIPLFCGYGIALGYSFYYYIWIFVLFLFVATLPVLVGALLSMPSLYVTQFLRKYKKARYVLSLVTYAGIFVLIIWLLRFLPEEINFLKTGLPRDKINAFTVGVSKALPPIAWLTSLLIGEPYFLITTSNGLPMYEPNLFISSTLPILGGLILAIAILVVLSLVLARPLFYKMASKPFEFAKKTKINPKPNRKAPVFLSAVKKEWIMAFRDGTVMSLITQFIIIMPLAIIVLNRLYEAMNLSLYGVQMTVVFNFAIVLLFMLSANIRLSSAYSKEGYAAHLNKTQPSNFGSRLLFAKLTINLVAGLLATIIATVVYSQYYLVGTVNLWMFAVTVYAAFVAHLFWCGEMDLMNPQYEQYATFSEQTNNPNENKASLLTFVIALLFAMSVFLLMDEGIAKIWLKAMIVAIALAAFKIFTFFLKIRVYYKEK